MTKPLADASHVYAVERRARHAERPGFRINELQISPVQEVPWHMHTRVRDTLYVIDGTLRVYLGDPDKEIVLGPADSFVIAPGRPHRVTNAGATSATFLAIQGIGEYDFVPLA
jgi:quercetin dioxygenase-like cupin family protein